jgi:hypothetical protein
MRDQELAALKEERDRLRNACAQMNDEVSQTLGKALRYPWFKDDQKNFPSATEADGVCVGEHVAETLAMEAARRLEAAEALVKGAEEIYTRILAVLADYGYRPKGTLEEGVKWVLESERRRLYEAQHPMLPNGEAVTISEMYARWQTAEALVGRLRGALREMVEQYNPDEGYVKTVITNARAALAESDAVRP